MTHEWKNDRYEGALAESIEIDVFYDDSEGLRRGSHSTADVLVNSFDVNEGTRNLLADAAINAKRVEELEEENGQLKQHVFNNGVSNDIASVAGQKYEDLTVVRKSVLDHLQEENTNLLQALKSSVEHVRMFDAMVDERDAEIAALKAKYTPRPMSEAPRDGTLFYAEHVYTGSWDLVKRRESEYNLHIVYPETKRGAPLIAFKHWLPADTFKGDTNG
jgi:hypothetical protein